MNRVHHQLGLKHGAVTCAYVSPIPPALPDNNMRTEVNIMKKILLASAGVLALGGVANANGWPSHLQNVQDYYAAALAVNVGTVNGNRSMTSIGQDNSAALRGSGAGQPRGRPQGTRTGHQHTRTLATSASRPRSSRCLIWPAFLRVFSTTFWVAMPA